MTIMMIFVSYEILFNYNTELNVELPQEVKEDEGDEILG